MKRFISLLMLVIVIVGIVPVAVGAEENNVHVIYFEDGSYMTVEVLPWKMQASGSTSGGKRYTYYDLDGVSQWRADLTGTFSYNGSSATCTSSSVDVTIINSGLYVISKKASKSGNTASASVTMGCSYDGIMTTIPANLSLKCDKNGNLS